MKQNLRKVLLSLVTVSVLSSNVFAAPSIATTKPTLTVTGTITPSASLSLGTAAANSGQAQTLTFPMTIGVAETQFMDGSQGGNASGLIVSDNDFSGWSIKVDSQNGGNIKGSATSVLIPYAINVDGVAVASMPLTSANTPFTIPLTVGTKGLAAAYDELHVLSASHDMLPPTQEADVYSDVVTFYLYSL